MREEITTRTGHFPLWNLNLVANKKSGDQKKSSTSSKNVARKGTERFHGRRFILPNRESRRQEGPGLEPLVLKPWSQGCVWGRGGEGVQREPGVRVLAARELHGSHGTRSSGT